jgi:hypothetical protein
MIIKNIDLAIKETIDTRRRVKNIYQASGYLSQKPGPGLFIDNLTKKEVVIAECKDPALRRYVKSLDKWFHLVTSPADRKYLLDKKIEIESELEKRNAPISIADAEKPIPQPEPITATEEIPEPQPEEAEAEPAMAEAAESAPQPEHVEIVAPTISLADLEKNLANAPKPYQRQYYGDDEFGDQPRDYKKKRFDKKKKFQKPIPQPATVPVTGAMPIYTPEELAEIEASESQDSNNQGTDDADLEEYDSDKYYDDGK